MAFWRGDEHRRARQSESWRKRLGSVTVPKPIHPPTEEKLMADSPLPVEPKEGADVKLDAHPAPVAAKAQSFVQAHKTALLVAAGAVVVFILAHFVA